MTAFVHRLEPIALDPEVPIRIVAPESAPAVGMDDPALAVMTDLRRVRVVTIGAEAPVELALTMMIHAHVRLLCVIDAGVLRGLVTARDLMGEKPLLAAARDRVPRSAITVAQVMTPRAEIAPFAFADVQRSTVRDVVVALRAAARQHALVVEPCAGACAVRGIFSATQIGRQLGIDISPDGRVQGFAEFERLLATPDSDSARRRNITG